jgi:PadR family transcriptional regulator, regulatory protein PadR
MKFLSRSEEMFLLAIWRLHDNAYGVTIRNNLQEVTGKTWAFGALFITLERLVKKEFLTSYLTEPTPERGGRSKRIYRITADGLEALKEIKKMQETLWAGIPELSLDKIVK